MNNLLQHIITICRTIRIASICALCSLTLAANAKQYTVVIDAGHGGKDAGAIGRVLKIKEKDLNLDISLRLASSLRTAYPDIKVVLTRSQDEFLPLQTRADIVNANNADLFICIHTNSAKNTSAHGAETFILGTDRMDSNLDVAMRENAVMKLEQDYQTTYEGFDPNSVDSYIMFELMQNKYIDQSLQFATYMQTNFSNNQQLNDRGVRQAAFWVLHKSACPSVLIEMGFISNKEEEKYMASDKGKREITNAIFTAFKQYYNAVKQPDKQKQVQAPDTLPMPKQKTTEPAKQNKNKQNTTPQKQTTIKQQSKASAQSTVYRVQIFSSRKLLKETDKEFKGLKGCIHRQRGEWYRYLYGEYSTQEQAQKKCEELKKLFPGCFVAEDER